MLLAPHKLTIRSLNIDIKRKVKLSFITSFYTRVRDKKRLEKVGNLVKNSYLYR